MAHNETSGDHALAAVGVFRCPMAAVWFNSHARRRNCARGVLPATDPLGLT
jgi:hypothetical protein